MVEQMITFSRVIMVRGGALMYNSIRSQSKPLLFKENLFLWVSGYTEVIISGFVCGLPCTPALRDFILNRNL